MTYSCIRTLLVSDATERRSTDDQYFQGVIVIVLGFHVAVVDISEKSQNPDQKTVLMKKIGGVPTGRVDCMRNSGGAGSRRGCPTVPSIQMTIIHK